MRILGQTRFSALASAIAISKETLVLSPQSSFLRQRSHLTPPELNWATVQRCLLNWSKMKQPSEDNKQKKRRKTLLSLCSVSALLLSVACCMALIHVQLRIQEHHRLISHSVTVCDQMETQILRKVQQNYERWQVTKVDDIKGRLRGTNGKENFYKMFWFLMLTSACFRSWRLWNLSLFNIMYRSNRSFNNPPPRAYPGHLTPLPSRAGGNLIISPFQGVGNLIPMR